MTDRRATPANPRVVARHLAPSFPDLIAVEGALCRVAVPVLDLLREPDGARDRQLLWGERVCVYEDRLGWSFVQAQKDGYVGYVRSEALGPDQPMTHRVSASSTHLYQAPDIKSPDRAALSFGSLIRCGDASGDLCASAEGFVPRQHLSRIETLETDPVAVAALFLGTPYLWGGNSRFGIDCSGLVQAALVACGIPCPGDSDQQQQALGVSLPAGADLKRNDLLFWPGHVALVSDPDHLVHANAHHMAVTSEPIKTVIERIEQSGQGSVTAHKRL